jgi:hypothetical protein
MRALHVGLRVEDLTFQDSRPQREADKRSFIARYVRTPRAGGRSGSVHTGHCRRAP